MSSLPSAVREAVRVNRSQLFAVACLLGAGIAADAVFGMRTLVSVEPATVAIAGGVAVMWVGWAFLVAFIIHRLRARRVARAGGAPVETPLLESLLGFAEDRKGRIAALWLTSFLFFLLMQAFSGFKLAIPHVQPFRWDEAFIQLDRFLHFGVDPWVLVHPLLGRPRITWLLDRLYYAWFPIVALGFLFFSWVGTQRQRARFLGALAGTWIILGIGAAMAFSSVGPCFFWAFTDGHEPFDPLMAYLSAVDDEYGLTALAVQEALWANHQAQGTLPHRGIAAMPSLHVAMPALFTLVALEHNRWLAGALGLYTVATLVGSVHLGWHYAVDGYVSIAAVLVLWKAAQVRLRVSHAPDRLAGSHGAVDEG